MNKVRNIFRTSFVVISCVIVILLIIPFTLLFSPFEMLCYHQMPYYKDLKKKYHLFITMDIEVRIYNHIIREQLPIQYFRNDKSEYYMKEGQILLCGWSNEKIEQVGEEWYSFITDEDDNPMAIKDLLELERELLEPIHKDLQAKYLVFYDKITDANEFEKAKKCPYFYCVYSMDDF